MNISVEQGPEPERLPFESLIEFAEEGVVKSTLLALVAEKPEIKEDVTRILQEKVDALRRREQEPDEIDKAFDEVEEAISHVGRGEDAPFRGDMDKERRAMYGQLLLGALQSWGQNPYNSPWRDFVDKKLAPGYTYTVLDSEDMMRAGEITRSLWGRDVRHVARFVKRFFPGSEGELYAFLKKVVPKAFEGKEKSKVFVSHASADRLGDPETNPTAKKFRDFLTALDQDVEVDVWIDEKGIQAGDDFADRIVGELRTSDRVYLPLTNASMRSPWVLRELELAQYLGKKIIPVQLEALERPLTEAAGSKSFEKIKERIFNRIHVLNVNAGKKDEVSVQDQIVQAAKLSEEERMNRLFSR